MIYICCWPWHSIGCDDHNLGVSPWYMRMHSLIHLSRAPIYPNHHLVSVFALNLFLDYLNQLPPLAPVKQRRAQVATSPLSDLDSPDYGSLWVREEQKGREEGEEREGKKKHHRVLFIRGGNSCIRPKNCEALLWNNISQIKWCEIKGGGELAAIPLKTLLKCVSALIPGVLMCCCASVWGESGESGCLPEPLSAQGLIRTTLGRDRDWTGPLDEDGRRINSWIMWTLHKLWSDNCWMLALAGVKLWISFCFQSIV